MTEVEFRAHDAAGEVRIFRARTGPGGPVPDEMQGVMSGVIQDITLIGEADRDASGKILGVCGTIQDVGEPTLAGSATERSGRSCRRPLTR